MIRLFRYLWAALAVLALQLGALSPAQAQRVAGQPAAVVLGKASAVDGRGAIVFADFTRGLYRAPTTNLIPNSTSFIAGGGNSVIDPTPVLAPDGTLTARRFNFTPGLSSDYAYSANANISAPTGAYSGSIWIRGEAGATIWAQAKRRDNGTATFGPTRTVTLTGEWQRVTGLTWTGAADNSLAGIAIQGSSFPTTASWVELWGAQLEPHGGQPGPYVATVGAARTESPAGGFVDVGQLSGLSVSRASVGYAETRDGLLVQFPANAPRITDRGLLVEESRTNLLLQSQAFQNAWTVFSGGVTADFAAAPDGSLSADAVFDSSAGGSRAYGVGQLLSKAGVATAYTASVYVRQGALPSVFLSLDDGTATNRAWMSFNLQAAQSIGAGQAGTFGYTSSGAQALGGGWFRVWVTGTTDANVQVRMAVIASPLTAGATAATPGYVGTGAAAIVLWGAQLEQGSFVTSYVPTTTAAATRPADRVVVFGSLLPAQFSVVAVQGGIPSVAGVAGDFPRVFSFNDGDGTDQIDVYRRTTSQGLVEVSPAAASVTTAYSAAPPKSQTFGRVAVAVSYDGSAVRVSANGSSPVGGSATVPVGVINRLDIANRAAGDRLGNGYFERIALYPRAFSDAELQAITSPIGPLSHANDNLPSGVQRALRWAANG